jgi:hypothetical protein
MPTPFRVEEGNPSLMEAAEALEAKLAALAEQGTGAKAN